MNTLSERVVSHPLTEALGWTLLHVAWQAAIAGLVVWFVLQWIRSSRANLRYTICCMGLLAIAIAPVATFLWLSGSSSPSSQTIPDTATVAVPMPDGSSGSVDAPAAAAALPPGDSVSVDDSPRTPPVESTFTLRRALPLIVGCWVFGVVVLTVRLLLGLRRIRQWRVSGTAPEPVVLNETFARLLRTMRVRDHVRLLESSAARVPAVIGWLRPVVLLPTGMISSLTATELESILAHELAHIRRHDYLVNLLQTLLETVLFYHPAVWWISHQARIEREHCCDDIAVTVSGNRSALARALARVEELRCDRQLVAATGGRLVDRIRRILAADVTNQPPRRAGTAAIVSVAVLLGGLALPIVTAGENEARLMNEESDDDYPVHKAEQTRTDTKTGLAQRVFTGIRLETQTPSRSRRRQSSVRQAELDMKYSNVLRYTFIPARVAKELDAVELGRIDFGATPPPRMFERPYQSMQTTDTKGSPTPPASKSNNKHVHEVDRPVRRTKIVPYADDALWVPGHLGFYGMNKTKQHVFRIVRISRVDLGVGPKFGNVNALVLDDANSDFGLLGRDWSSRPRGENGESLWFAADGSFHFMAGAKQTGTRASTSGGQMSVTSSGSESPAARPDRRGVRVLKTHTYNTKRRESTDVISVNGSNVPIDQGIRHGDLTVYATLFYDIVAVDSATGRVQWNIPWRKQTPTWHTVSVVELTLADGTARKAVELFASTAKTHDLVFRYHDLATGELIRFQPPSQASSAVRSSLVRVVSRDGDRVTRASVSAGPGRSPLDLVRSHQAILKDRAPGATVTERETIVSADNAHYLIGDGMDAPRVVFRLPQGSRLRVEFTGKNVEIREQSGRSVVTVTEGRIEIIDAGGVIRARASADGGAEQIVAECRVADREIVMSLRSRWADGANRELPPVQVKMNTKTGAPQDSEIPHGGIRYALDPATDNPVHVRMRMLWRYDLDRLARQVEVETGKPWRESLSPRAKATDPPWGPKARNSDLSLRLVPLTKNPQVGKPLKLRLELRNTGTDEETYDPQYYAPFRTLRVINAETGNSDAFTGMTPQTSGGPVRIAPGQTRVLWKSTDVADLYMLDAGIYRFKVMAPRRSGGKLPGSNEITVRVAPGSQLPQKKLLRALQPVAPKGWKVSKGRGAIYLTHAPTGLKRDATTIQVWFTKDKLADDFVLGKGDKRRNVATIGKTSTGYLHVAGLPLAESLWPDYASRIRMAAENSGVLK